MKIKIKKLVPEAIVPHKGTPFAAAYDLYAVETAYIPPGETVVVGTGLAMEIPRYWKGDIYSRSGLASRGVVVANAPGKIDSDYRGEIKVILHNNRNRDVACVEAGDRIAQFEISLVHQLNFDVVTELSETERGKGGLGSTGH